MNEPVDQLLEKYPYLKNFTEELIIVDDTKFLSYKEDEKIKIGKNVISVKLLKEIISLDNYYELAKKLFSNEIESFRVCRIIYGDLGDSIYLSKGDIIKGLDVIIQQGLAVFDELAYRRYDALKQEITYDKFLEKYKGNNYNITIEGRKYSIPIIQMMDVLNLSQEEFDKICNSSDIKVINGISIEHYFFAIISFFKENNLAGKYQFPQAVKEKIIELSSLQKVDIEAVNKITVISDSNIDKVQINPELKAKILEGLPTSLTEIEKAIYIYIKMCKLLTYDDEFYAVNQRGEVALKHEAISHVQEITPINNKVVCYEFNAIYGKLLQEIGLTFSTDQALIDGFGGGHANLRFRSGKFLIDADSVTSILQGDILKAKLNQELDGLKCVNKNKQSKQEFKDLLTKMYTIVVTQEMNLQKQNQTSITQSSEVLQQVEHTETFEEIVAQYKKVTKQIVHISLSEKIDILMQKVNDSRLVGIDSLSYILHLKKVLFTKEEREKNISITILRDNVLVEPNQVATASAIIAINQFDLKENAEETLYYLYHPSISFNKISLEEIQRKINEGQYSYIEESAPEIPGVTTGGMKK